MTATATVPEQNDKRRAFHGRVWRVRRSDAVRLEHWLQRLHANRAAVHGEARIVPYRSGESTALVCTFDGKACGCAYCGEFAAEVDTPFEQGFRLLHIRVPYDVARIIGPAAILYCDACLTKHGAWLRLVFNVAPGEVRS